MGIWTSKDEDHSHVVLVFNPKNPKTAREDKALNVREEGIAADGVIAKILPTVEEFLKDWPSGPPDEEVEPLSVE